MSNRISYEKIVVFAFIFWTTGAAPRSNGAQIDATWIGGTSNWNTATHWSPTGVPSNGGGNTYRVFIDHGETGISSVASLDVSVQIDTLTIDAGDSLGIDDNQILALLVGPIANAGTLSINSSTNYTYLRLDGNVSLTGGGTVTLSNIAWNRIYGNPGTNRLTNADNTIRGSGEIGMDSMALTNQGVIQADQVTALTIDPSSAGAINSGTLRATAGATLNLNSGNFDNTGGTIEAQTGSIVAIYAALITSGTLTTSGTGVVAPNASSLDSVTNNGQLALNDNAVVALSNTMTNNATITLNSTANYTDLLVDTDVILTGGGTVALSNFSWNRIYGNPGTNRLTNADNTIRGSGEIGMDSMALTNQSVIQADQVTALTIDPSSAGAINSGTLRATAGATLNLNSGNFDNTGGTIEAQTGSIVAIYAALITSGTLTTSGTGVVAPNASSLDSVTNNGQLALNDNAVVALSNTMTNNATITLNSTANYTDLLVDTDVILTGGGTVALSNLAWNRIYGNPGTNRLTNADNTIRGSGEIGMGSMALTNQSVIQADQVTALTIQPSATGAINTGTLRATAGATLNLSNGAFDNTGGTIEAQNGSTVAANTASITNGILTTAGTGQVLLNYSSLQDVTNNGQVAINDSQIGALLGTTLTNVGIINLNSTTNYTQLRLDADISLTGGGTIVLSNSPYNQIYGSTGTYRLTNVNNTIQGGGQLGVNSMGLTNQGTIDANLAAGMTIDVTDTLSFDNQGQLKATGAGGLNIASGPFTTSGTVTVAAGSQLSRTGNYTQTAGTTTVNGALSASGIVDLQGGILKGSGNVTANVTNAGAIQPGNSAGILSINGNFTQTSAGETLIEIGGLIVGTEYDRLAITGTAALNGTLRVNLVDGFVPGAGNSFTIMTYASQTGNFSNLIVPCSPGGHLLRVDVTPTAVVITALPGLIGDVDCDCALTVADIQAFILALLDPAAFAIAYPGCDISGADIDQNGTVDGRDIQAFVDLLLTP